MNSTEHTRRRRRRKPGLYRGKIWPGGDGNHQFTQLLDRLIFAVLPTEEFVHPRGLTKPQRRRLRWSGKIWQRFAQQRGDPATRLALVERMHRAQMTDFEIETLLVARTMREAWGTVLLTAVRPAAEANPQSSPLPLNLLADVFGAENGPLQIQAMLSASGGLLPVVLRRGGPPPFPPRWGGPWDKTLWRRPSPLARAIAGIGLETLPPMPRDLASATAGLPGGS
jgi:hypothetical protein